MLNPRVYSLGDRAITAAVTDEVITEGLAANGAAQALIDRLEGMKAVTLTALFTYGSGGTSVKVDVETCLDGFNWIPIARFAFTTATAHKTMTVSGLTPKTAAAAIAALSDDTALDGVLGDRLRAKITSTGTYAGNTSVSVRASVR